MALFELGRLPSSSMGPGSRLGDASNDGILGGLEGQKAMAGCLGSHFSRTLFHAIARGFCRFHPLPRTRSVWPYYFGRTRTC